MKSASIWTAKKYHTHTIGTSFGGKRRIGIVGVLIVMILNNGLLLSDVSPVVVLGLQGVIIIVAVAISFDRGKGGSFVIK